MKKECGGRVWYSTQYSLFGRAWVDDTHPKFETEEAVQAFVVRLNTPSPVTTTTILGD